MDSTKEYLVSALVPTYNAERFMRGLLEDLEAQTIADRMEIIVVDTDSPTNERGIVEEFQQRYDNIVYVRTSKRENSHIAGNRAIRLARGKYLAPACTDDRRKPDALERMVAVLEARPDIALVYANVWITKTENETFEEHTPAGKYRWMDFDPFKLLVCCFMGPQPVWRRSLHEKYGYLDGGLRSAGDWEFWLRMAEAETFLHIDEFLGLYLYSPTSSEHLDPDLSRRECELVQQRYIHRAPELHRKQRRAQLNLSATSEILALVARDGEPNEMVTRCVEQLHLYSPTSEKLSIKVVTLHPDIPDNDLDVKVSPSVPTVLEALRQGTAWEARYVVLLSPDVLVSDSWLDRMLAVAEHDPSIAAVGPTSNIAPAPQQVGSDCPNFDGLADRPMSRWEEVPYLGSFCVLLKSEAVCKVGGLREGVSLPLSLLDLYARLQADGFKRVCAKGVYVHREELTDSCDVPAADQYVRVGTMAAGQSALEHAHFETAVSEFERLTRDLPGLAAGHIALGSALMCLGRNEEAVHFLQRGAELTPYNAALHNQLGIAMCQLGDRAAETAFLTALKANPTNVETWLRLTELYREQGRYAEATESIKQAVRLRPNCARALSVLGILGLELGNPKPARAALKHLQMIEPDHPIVQTLQRRMAGRRIRGGE